MGMSRLESTYEPPVIQLPALILLQVIGNFGVILEGVCKQGRRSIMLVLLFIKSGGKIEKIN